MPQRLDTVSLPGGVGGMPPEIPVLVLDSGRPGPRVLVTANVHGDELTGLAVVHALPAALERSLLRGSVHLYPSLNPAGLAARTRRVPVEDQDLNRLFPGDRKGTPSDRLAHALWSDIRRRGPDLLVDIHADSQRSIPYAIADRAVTLDRPERSAVEHEAECLCRATGLTVLREFPDDLYLAWHLDRTLAGATMNLLHRPSVTIEAGPRLVFDHEAVSAATGALLGVLGHAGLLDHRATPHSTRIAGGPWRRDAGPRASTAGVLHPLAAPGDPLDRQQPVAEIRALSGRLLETLLAPCRSYLVALPDRAWVAPGAAVATFAVPD